MNIKIVSGDITTFSGDVIVNAANQRGLGGGGVDGAIHRAAGPQLREACLQLPIWEDPDIRIPIGAAIPTPAFDLPCKWVIHTTGPVWPTDPDEVELARAQLASCYASSAMVACGMRLKSIAYPAISTGVYGCPMEVCAEVAMKELLVAQLFFEIETTIYIYFEEHVQIWQDLLSKSL